MLADLREAARSLIRTPGPTLVVLVTLAVAIGANTAIFSALNSVLLRPLDYAEPDRLVVLWGTQQEQGIEGAQVSTADYRDWREGTSAFDGMAAYRYLGHTLTGNDRPERIQSVEASPVLFQMLGVDASLGRTFSEAEEAPGNEHLLLLSHASWTRRFGERADIVDGTVELDGEAFTVVGVMPPGFTFPAGDRTVEAWLPLTLSDEALMTRPHRMHNVVGRLAAGASIERASEEVNAVASQLAEQFPGSNEGWGVRVVSAHDELVGDIGATLWLLFGAVLSVLLIGCVNVANVLVTRSTESAKDFVIRAALGSGRLRLIRRSMIESLLLATLGGIGGLLAASWGVSLLRTVMPPSVPRGDTLAIDPTVLAFTAALTLGAGILFGLMPALRVMAPNLAEALKTNSRGSSIGRRGRWLSEAMVVLEVAMALILLTGAGLMIRSFGRLNAVDPGFRTDSVVSVALSLPPSRYGFESQRLFFPELARRVQEIPGVEEAGAVSMLPMSEVGTTFEMPFTVLGLEAESPTERPRADFRGITPGYLEAMAIPLRQGRTLDEFDMADDGPDICLINEALARRYFDGIDPIGKRLQMPMAGELEIVGVVGNIRHGGLQSDVRPELFVPYPQLPLATMHLVAYSLADPAAIAAAVGDQILTMDPELAPTEVVQIRDLLYDSVAQPRFNMALLTGLAFCAAVLAAVGIYGVVAYSVVQRTEEIGVRMALGAGGGDTVRLIVRQSSRALLAGVVLGLFGALASSRFIAGLLYGVEATDAGTYAAVSVAVLAIGLAAAAIPAARASRVDPVKALRRD